MQEQIGDLILINILGKGTSGEVYLSQKKGRKELFAIKKLNRNFIDGDYYWSKNFEAELEILKTLNHPNTIKFEDIITTKNNYYLITEYANGGGLSDCLKKYIEEKKCLFQKK